ncbi:PulJ/GspJ family protein [Actinoplanes sp. CA-030573]|uniref:PulJ/GspJ family protein n=1 Tax=Actinoplanes sp. CA-030573 TaxID=3239898 RepID=UPI003D94984E
MSDDLETPERRDEGFSLIDVLVATSIMAVIMVFVTGAILEIYSDVNRTDGISTARDQVGNSFRRLDKELRYATWVATPGKVGDGWYLEYATSSTDCQQLAFRNGVLTRSTWTLPGTSPGSPTTIATDLAPTPGVDPFTVYEPGDKPYATAAPGVSGVGGEYELEHDQVRLRFSGRAGKVELPLDVLFTAQNTNRNTPALNDCSKGRPAA